MLAFGFRKKLTIVWIKTRSVRRNVRRAIDIASWEGDVQ